MEQPEDILREFVSDCHAAAISSDDRKVMQYLESEWYDLAITYNKAVTYLKHLDQLVKSGRLP